MSDYYTCTAKHKSVRYRTNYVTKIAECARHHCNHRIEQISRGNGIIVLGENAKVKLLDAPPPLRLSLD